MVRKRSLPPWKHLRRHHRRKRATTDAQSALIEIERNSLHTMFTLLAAAREVEAVAYSDARLMASAENIRHIALTMDTVGTEVLVRLATINDLSEGLLARLVVARAAETGMSLPCYPNALAFFDPILAQLDHVLRDPWH
jgi:hypothetical protein